MNHQGLAQRARIVLLSVTALFFIAEGTAHAQAPVTRTREVWVNYDTGFDDPNPAHHYRGTFRFPWHTLSFALAKAGAVGSDISTIYFVATATPIAPYCAGSPSTNYGDVSHPGLEPCTLYPIQMIPGVSIIGVADAQGHKPIMMLREYAPSGGSFVDQLYSYNGATAYVLAASNCTLKGFVLTGADLRTKKLTNTIDPTPWRKGVLATDVTSFLVQDCDIVEMHTGIFIDEHDDSALVTSVTVANTMVTGCFPQKAAEWVGADPVTQAEFIAQDAVLRDSGHAGIWAQASRTPANSAYSTVNLTTIGCHFIGNHDGIESNVANETGQPPTEHTEINVVTTNCTFLCGESGIEIVKQSVDADNACNATVTGCVFENNWNRPKYQGGYQPTGVGSDTVANNSACIAHRGKFTNVKVRGSLFRNNATAVAAGGSASLDLGECDCAGPDCTPGLNTFCLDVNGSRLAVAAPTDDEMGTPHPHDPWNLAPNNVVILALGKPVPGPGMFGYDAPAAVTACGNRWVPSNQVVNSDNPVSGSSFIFGSYGQPLRTTFIAPYPASYAPHDALDGVIVGGVSVDRNLAIAVPYNLADPGDPITTSIVHLGTSSFPTPCVGVPVVSPPCCGGGAATPCDE